MPVPVAARRLGKSPDTIRSAIRRGKLSATKGNDGQWRVWLPVEAGLENKPADSAQRELDSLRAELAASVQREVHSATEVADLRERLARAEGENAVLRSAVEWHRLPWWRRLIG